MWPEYNLHGDVVDEWWEPSERELPEYQFALYDEDADQVLAEGQTGPLAWNGDDTTLPGSIDEALARFLCPRSALVSVGSSGIRGQGSV